MPATKQAARIIRCADTKAKFLLQCLPMDTAVPGLTLERTMKQRP
jgi:hypothetical protein